MDGSNKKKWFVQGTRTTRYRADIIEASTEEYAVKEYAFAVEGGVVGIESISELEIDSGEEYDE